MTTKGKVCVVGLGYIGLPTAALLADSGFEVIGVDTDPEVVATVNAGEIHIVEPGLESIVTRAVTQGRLRSALSPEQADVYLICVPTPFKYVDDSPQPDLRYVIDAAHSIAAFVSQSTLVIIESTCPVGTTEIVSRRLGSDGSQSRRPAVAYCPERVLPGRILFELVNNDRIVGGVDDRSTKLAADFYRRFVIGEVLETDSRTAEMCKLAENSFRDLNIAFANELSMLCRKDEIDVWQLIRLANRHPRVSILQPGVGVGGHCIAVDPWFIVARDPSNAQIIRKSREVNTRKTEWVTEEILLARDRLENDLNRNVTVACLGLSFKPDIDDLRESPALKIVQDLISSGVRVVAVEPNVNYVGEIHLLSLSEALTVADLIVVLVNHKEFAPHRIPGVIAQKRVLDFCGAFAKR